MNWCSLLLVCCCMIWLYHQIKFNRSYYLVMLLPFNHVLQAFFFLFYRFGFCSEIQNNVSVHKNFGFFCTFVYDKPVWLDATFFFNSRNRKKNNMKKRSMDCEKLLILWNHCCRFYLISFAFVFGCRIIVVCHHIDKIMMMTMLTVFV